MARTIVITGSASGIGRATAERCAASGDRVIGVDLRDADIEVDLGAAAGRAKLVEEVTRLAPDGIDGLLAGAGLGRPDMPREVIALNYFGTVATLEGLRPLLAKSSRPRAVAISSTAGFMPGNPAIVAACLSGDEDAAIAAITAAPASAYPDSKRALSMWLRRAAVRPEWAGSGILLNAVGPGVTRTAMTAPLLGEPQWVEVIKQTNPVAVKDYAEPGDIAELLQYLLSFENTYTVGQIIYIDGGSDPILRPTDI